MNYSRLRAIFLVVACVGCLVAVFYLVSSGVDRRIVAGPVRSVSSTPVLDAWISPAGDLLWLSLRDQALGIYSMGPSASPRLIMEIDVSRLAGGRTPVAWSKSGVEFAEGEFLPLAVSGDGAQVAFFWDHRIEVRQFSKGARSPFVLATPRTELSRLVFTQARSLAVIDEEGTLKGVDYATGDWSKWSVPLGGAWTIWSRGPLLVLSSFGSGDVLSLSIGESRINMRMQRVDPERGVSLAVSRSGKIAIGTEGGLVLVEEENLVSKVVALPSGRPIQAVAFAGDSGSMVAVSAEGVYWIDDDGLATLLSGLRGDAELVAVGPPGLAFGGAGGLFVTQVDESASLNEFGHFVLTSYSILLAFLALVYSFQVDRGRHDA